MRKKILFLNPPLLSSQGLFNRPIRFPTFSYATYTIHPPLFLAYACSYLRSQGFSVDLIDAIAGGNSLKEVLEIAKNKGFESVVIETSTPSFYNDLEVAKRIKETGVKKIIFVGTHVSCLPEEALKYPWVDAVIRGEYEISLYEYLKTDNPDTKGIGLRTTEGKIKINPSRDAIEDLDILPYPARDLLRKYKYFDPILRNPFTFVLAGRGCPYRCIFCNWPQVLTGRKYRKRNPQKVGEELEYIKNNFYFKSILFNDDTLTVDRNNVYNICREIIKRNLKLNWACYARADFDDEDTLRLMRKAGCFLLKVGVESGDEEILKKAKKPYSLKKVKRTFSLMRSLGFHIHATFVFGLPGENQETIKKTIHLAKELKPSTVQFSMAIPYPGTEFFNFLKKNSFLHTENWQDYMPLRRIFDYPDLSSEDLRKAVKCAYQSYYFRPQLLCFALKRLICYPKDFVYNLKQFFKLLFTNNA
ncbi:MAG: radical SAM protein [Candidatus Omnitrophica bacterium]|nr:radical SAM protein [Candidatus Omnitrophota bacterium]MCM8793083.1 radical SAM protein [Candidatus Omnitrophota bacterium]